MKLLIGILPRPLAYAQFWMSVLNMDRPPGSAFMMASGSRVDRQRNSVVREMLDGGYDYLLFLDDDHIVPKDALFRLLAHQKDFVTGLYVTRAAKPRTTQMMAVEDKFRSLRVEDMAKPLIEIDASGMGCALISRKLLQTVEPPWFQVSMDADGDVTGEDVSFCRKAQRDGFKLYCDTTLSVPHITPIGIGLNEGQIAYLIP